MTDLPYGKGGSPLQNLIKRNHTKTVVTALKMEKKFDSGPIYFKKKLSLKGSAHVIYTNFALIAFDLIKKIISEKPKLKKQLGRTVVFKRRIPEESIVPKKISLKNIYDHIRMLDAPTYPKAFIEWGSKIIEFDKAEKLKGRVEARVIIYDKTKKRNY
tara:strand:+ start:99 stop:572 length:474 start_codon:yes stop_codon:yes gene_type:complete